MNLIFSWIGLNQQIEFQSPEYLWGLALAPLVVALSRFLAKRPWIVSWLRALAIMLVFAALADPFSQETSSSDERVALVDTSASISADATRAFVESLLPYLGEEINLKIYPFADRLSRTPIIAQKGDSASSLVERIRSATDIDSGETDIATSISEIAKRSTNSSVLLLSDGFPTAGDALTAARSAGEQGLRIFPVVPELKPFQRERLELSSLYAPITAHSNEAVEARITLENGFLEAKSGTLELWLDNDKLYAQTVEVEPAAERVVLVKLPTAKGGLRRIKALFKSSSASTTESAEQRHRWISIKEKAKMFMLSGAPEDERLLKQVIALKGFGLEAIVADGATAIPTDFSSYTSIVLNNVSARQLPAGFLPALNQFVAAGGGLLIIGGDKSFGLGGYIDTALEEISPLKFLPPQTEKRRLSNAIALVIDKSKSMSEDNRILAAKMAAMTSVQALKPEDFIGIVGFDSGPTLILDVMPVANAKTEMEAALRDLTPYGKTELFPALALARQRLGKVQASRKHIIVLSDGKFPLVESEYIGEINRLSAEGISVSSIAVGLDADVPFMTLLAKYGKGAFYQTLDPQRLPEIFLDDIKVSTGERTMKEGAEMPVGPGPAGLLSTQISGEPPLRGFVETLPKKGSELELIVSKDEKVFPLLASWSYESGRVIAFTSDANGRWSAPWVSWRPFANFWGDLFEGIKDRSNADKGELDFDFRYRVEQKRLTLDLAMFDKTLASKAAPVVKAEVKDPAGVVREIAFSSIKSGKFSATFDGARPGDYTVNIQYGSLKLPALAMTIDGEVFGEIVGNGLDVGLLEKLATLSSGQLSPEPQELLGIKRQVSNKTALAWIPILLAMLVVLGEALIREGAVRSVAERLLGILRVSPLKAVNPEIDTGRYRRNPKVGGRKR